MVGRGETVLDASPRGGRLDALRERDREAGSLILDFRGGDGERPFDEGDAAFAHAIANLAGDGCLPVAHADGALRGAELALVLFCPVVVLGAAAILDTGFGRPGSSAVYVAASRRLGTVACEHLLFSGAALGAADAARAHLAILADGAEGVEAAAAARRSTLLSVARANLITWPVARDAMLALVDGPSRGETQA